MKSPLLTAIAIILAVQVPSFAQHDYRQGYIVKSNGDSIAGFVDYQIGRKSAKFCLFKETEKGKGLRYLPQDISAYGFVDDKRYESKKLSIDSLTTSFVFIESLIKGHVNLYKHNGVFYLETTKLIQLPSKVDVMISIERGFAFKRDTRYIGILNHILYDCGLSADKSKYEERDIVNLIQNYNRCKGGVGVVYKQKKRWELINFQIFSGLNSSLFRVNGLSSVSFLKSYSPLIGGSIDISSPRLNDKTFVSFEASYQEDKYTGYGEIINGPRSIDRSNYLVDISFLKVPISFRYNFLTEAHTPYIKVGLVEFFKLKSSLQVLNEHERNQEVTTEFNTYNFFEKSQSGLWIGAGFSRIIKNKYKGFIELRYERTKGFSQFFYATSFSENINVLLGLRF